MKRVDSQYEFDRLMRLKWVLIVLDIIVFFIALATFGICLWIRFDLDFQQWVRGMHWYSYWYCMYVIMFAMVFTVLNTLLHAYGILSDSTAALGFTQFFHVVLMIIQFVGAVVICVYGVEESDVLYKELHATFLGLIYRMDYDPSATRALRMVQEFVHCCGARGSEDYTRAHKPVPMECRNQVTGKEYRYGCAQQMAWWLEPWTSYLAAACLALILLHVAQMIITSKVVRKIRQYRQPMDYEYD
jgi:hypothetical protein